MYKVEIMKRMKTIRLIARPHLLPHDLERAADLLRKGNLVAIPTETVYGLAADVFQEEAVREIFRVKRRPIDNPLIAHIAQFSELERLILAPCPLFLRLAELFWPGPLTLIALKQPGISDAASAGLSTMAVRMPSHPVARQLLEAVRTPLVAPSANRSGCPSPTSVEDVLEDLEGKIPAIIDGGPCSYGIESTVLLIREGRPILLRLGAIAPETIEEAIGMRLERPQKQKERAILSPGTHYRHYAPNARIHLVKDPDELQTYIASGAYVPPLLNAKNLYFQLRQADRLGFTDIVIFLDEDIRSNETLMNRLEIAQGSSSYSE